MTQVKHISYYTNVMQQWAKPLGAKPTEAQLATAHVHGRPGKQSLIVAMALRDSGVTRSQMLGAAALFDGKATPQLNHMRALVGAHMFTRDTTVSGYKLTVGPKHQQYADLHGAKAAAKAEPAKPAKAATKPRKPAKAKPQAEPVIEPVVADAPQAEQPAA